MNQTLFFILLRPIEAVLASISPIIDQAALSQKLFFADFVKKLIFAHLEQIKRLSKSFRVYQQSKTRGCDWLCLLPFAFLLLPFYFCLTA